MDLAQRIHFNHWLGGFCLKVILCHNDFFGPLLNFEFFLCKVSAIPAPASASLRVSRNNFQKVGAGLPIPTFQAKVKIFSANTCIKGLTDCCSFYARKN